MTASSLPQYADVIVPSTTMYNNALMVYMLPQSLVTTSIIIALFTWLAFATSTRWVHYGEE